MSDKIVGLNDIWAKYFASGPDEEDQMMTDDETNADAGVDVEDEMNMGDVMSVGDTMDPSDVMNTEGIRRSTGDSTTLDALAHFYQVDPRVLSSEQACALYHILFRNGKDDHLLSNGKELFVLSDCMFYLYIFKISFSANIFLTGSAIYVVCIPVALCYPALFTSVSLMVAETCILACPVGAWHSKCPLPRAMNAQTYGLSVESFQKSSSWYLLGYRPSPEVVVVISSFCSAEL